MDDFKEKDAVVLLADQVEGVTGGGEGEMIPVRVGECRICKEEVAQAELDKYYGFCWSCYLKYYSKPKDPYHPKTN